jgi:hypothetical protein
VVVAVVVGTPGDLVGPAGRPPGGAAMEPL